MASADVIVDGFARVRGTVHQATEGLEPDQLSYRVDSQANSIAWLVWHLTRVQDDHVADAAQEEQLWTADNWTGRYDLPFDRGATGYGHSSDEVAAVRVPSAELLVGYHDAVHDKTVRYVEGLRDEDLTRIVDDSWDPPVSLGVRLVSVISDNLQHAGQAAFVRGLVERRDAVT